MQLTPEQLQDLQKCYVVFEKVAIESLKRGLFHDFENSTIVGTALTKFKSILQDGNTSGRKSEKHTLDSRAGNSTGKRIGKHIQAKKQKNSEKPQEATGTGSGTGSETDPGLNEPELPFS
jgi:hypothetical protein